MAGLPVAASGPTPCRRRRPERTLLYRTVQTHFETWLALRGGEFDNADPVPGHVEREFRRYLACGIPRARLRPRPLRGVRTRLPDRLLVQGARRVPRVQRAAQGGRRQRISPITSCRTYAWAQRLARSYEFFPLLCPRCGAEMRIIAFLTDPAAVRPILAHLGQPTAPPPIAPARGPPVWDLLDAGPGTFDPQPAPEYEFDQRLAW